MDYIFPYDKPNVKNILRFELSEGDVIAIPNNYAHGFYSTSDNVVLQYIMNNEYSQAHYKGINGKEFISKELKNKSILISEKDLGLPNILNFNK